MLAAERRNTLFTPGPCMVPDDVATAGARADHFHRDPRFGDMCQRVCRDLVDLAGGGADDVCVPLGCSGSGALEAALALLGGPLMIVRTGVYAARLEDTARYIGLEPEGFAWSDGDGLARLRARLERGPAPKTIALVHHETAAGTLIDIEAIAAVAAEHGALVVADAVASFGGHFTRLAGAGFGAVVVTPNKCLESVPGLSFVIAPRAVMERGPAMRTSAYLDLPAQYRRLAHTGEPRFTLPVQVVAALDVALRRLERETLAGREARYRAMRAVLCARMSAIGLVPTEREGATRSSFVQLFEAPPPPLFLEWRDALAGQGLVIYTDRATLEGGTFYLSVAGDLAEDDIARLADAMAPLVAAWRTGRMAS